jgi:hypothetical protein
VDTENLLRRTIPVIAANMTAYKFKPEEPGGIDVLHQDRRP